jgi:hypothetical protein
MLMLDSADDFEIKVNLFYDPYPEKWDFSWLKVDRLLEHVISLPATAEYILYVDSRDILFLRPLDHICSMFNQIGAPLFFSTENKCAPHRDPAWAGRFPSQPEGFRFHNGGVYMAERATLVHALGQLRKARDMVALDKVASSEPSLATNDQHLWQAASLEGLIQTKLDSKQELFCSFHMCEFDDFVWCNSDNETPLVLKNGSCPAIAHFAGERGPTIQMFWHLLKTGSLKDL